MLKNALRIVGQDPSHTLPRLARNTARFGWHKYVLKNRFAYQHIHGSTMKLDLHDPGISRALFFLQDREKEHHFLLKRIVRPGHTILDLGANIGYYVLLEHRLMQGEGNIIAVEPSPQNFRLLEENVALNQLTNVVLKHGAVTENDGTAKLYLSALANVHSLFPNHSRATGTSISVPAYSIPTLAKAHGQIDLIRMDIEGYEQTILAGLVEHFDDMKPTILFELHPNTYDKQKFESVLHDFYAAGYSVPYLASSDKLALETSKIAIATSIATDGRIRHIGTDLTLEQVLAVVWNARCMVLAPVT